MQLKIHAEPLLLAWPNLSPDPLSIGPNNCWWIWGQVISELRHMQPACEELGQKKL